MKRNCKQFAVIAGIALAVVVALSSRGLSHCEIPCGIYDDPMRIQMMAEHIRTIEKSMTQIIALSEDKDKNDNQLTRWVLNKEDHADQLCEIATQYFMKQRIEPVEKSGGRAYEEYVQKLTLLHQIMVQSMKCKQTTDLDHPARLSELLDEFKAAWLGPEQREPSHQSRLPLNDGDHK